MALWCWLRGDDRGELLHQGRELSASLIAAGFEVANVTEAFRYADGRDLSGYEDGTENPKGDAAVDAAFVQGQGTALDGSSFVAVQTWRHNLDTFMAMPEATRDHVIAGQSSSRGGAASCVHHARRMRADQGGSGAPDGLWSARF